MNNRNNKPKMSSAELIGKMKTDKGIKFTLMNEVDAAQYIKNINNYLRTASYRINYNKNERGEDADKYIKLEFEYLRELSAIDLQFRHVALKMCLDVEHGLKVKLIKDIEEDPSDDGYAIVEEFLKKNPDIRRSILRTSGSPYTKDLIDKYFVVGEVPAPVSPEMTRRDIVDYSNCPVWVLLEVITFGDFIQFYNHYYKENRTSAVPIKILQTVKSLRNGCAHNNCVLANLRPNRTAPYVKISKAVRNFSKISNSQIKKRLSVRPVYELSCLLYAYKFAISDYDDKKNLHELITLFNVRMLQHKDYYIDNDIIVGAYNFAIELIEGFFPKEIADIAAKSGQSHKKRSSLLVRLCNIFHT